ncbi:MAG: PAS domain-containing protein [Candidatus Latescibacterota bacterium]
MPEVIVQFDQNMRIQSANPIFERVTGIPEERAVGHTPAELGIPESLVSVVESKVRSVFDTGKDSTLEFEYIGTEGKRFYHGYFFPEWFQGEKFSTVLATAHDVTDLVETRQELRENEERFRTITELITDYAYSFCIGPDSRLDVEWVYGAFEQITGYTPEDANIEGNWTRIIYPDDRETSHRRNETLLSGKENRCRLRIVAKDGTIHWLQDNARPIKDEQGRVVRVVGATADITDLKRAEEEARAQEKDYRTLAENSPDIIMRMDRELKYLYVNTEAERVTGIPRDRFIGKNDREIGMPEEIAAFWAEVLIEVVETGKERVIEYDFPDPEGTKHYQSRIVPETGENGTIQSILSVTRDITALKRAEEEIRRSEEKYRTLFTNLSEGFALCDVAFDETGAPAGLQCIETNQAYRNITGLEGEIIGITERETSPALESYWLEMFGKVALTGEPKHALVHGKHINKDLDVVAFSPERGRLALLVTDITERTQAEEELRTLKEELEEQVWRRTVELEKTIENIRTEIAEREKAKEEVRHSQRLLNAIYKTLPIGVFILDREGKIILMNPAAKLIWGGEKYVSPEGYGVYKGRWVDSGKPVANNEWTAVRALRSGKSILGEEVEIETFDGSIKIIRNSAVPLRNEQGEITGAMVLNEDITDQKLAEIKLRDYREHLEYLVDERTVELEQANSRLKREIEERKQIEKNLRESEEKFRIALKNAPIIMVMQDRDRRHIWVYDAQSRLKIEDVFGKKEEDFFPPEEAARLIEIKERVMATGMGERVEMPLTPPGVETVFLDITIEPMRNNEGEVIGVVSVNLNITERKRAEEALQDAKAHLEATLNALPDLMFEVDLNGTILGYHAPQQDRLSIPPEEFLGRKIPDVLPPKAADVIMNALQKAAGTGMSRGSIYAMEMPDGTEWFELSIASTGDPRKPDTRFIALVRDVTERKRVEEALRDSEVRFRAAVDNFPGVFLVYDAERRIQFVNRIGIEKSGHTREEIMGHCDEDVYPKSVIDTYMPSLLRAIETQEPQTLEAHLTPDGEYWVLMSFVPLLNAQGDIWQILVISYDITSRKHAEDALQESEVRFRAAVENFPGMFKVYDPDRRVRYINALGAALSGHTPDDIIGKRDEEYLPPEIADTFIPVLVRVMDTKTPQAMENRLNLLSGEMWFLVNFIPLLDDTQNIWQILGTAIDITGRKNAEERALRLNERLRRQAAQLETTNKELESFSYSISHDLRAPLRALDGFSLALEEDYTDKLDEKARDYISRIRAAAQRMARLIDDVLELSRTSRVELNYTTVNLSAQAQGVIEELRQAEPERSVEIIMQEGLTAEGDETLLRQVMQNLLGNAWKFTSHQEDARIEFGKRREDSLRIFFVRDNGAGFDMQYAENLFLPFRRLHTEAEFPGTGIGLSIVKRIIERHGGGIWAESEPGKGATFYFTLGEE